MNRELRRRFCVIAMPPLVLASLLAARAEAADGVIRFEGQIVAAPYELEQSPRPKASLRTGAAPHHRLVFGRQHVDRPSASVKVQTLHGAALALRFTSSAGDQRTFGPMQSQALGRDGGALSILPEAAPARRPVLALVTVNYD